VTTEPEFAFELRVCRWAERRWPPTGSRDSAVVVARQLGTRERRWDTVVIEADPDGLAARERFGAAELDSDLLHVVRHAPADWAWYRDALPDPGYPWRYVREAIHRAAARDAVETRRQGNRIQIRRVAPYPDWVRRIVAVENKPDLTRSAARRLGEQLSHDVDRALAEEVWVATGATGSRVEPALLEDLPVEAGVLTVGSEARESEVLWHPAALRRDAAVTASPGDDAGSPAGGGSDAPDDPPDRERRLVLAERAYGRGWRSYLDSMRPDCRHFELTRSGATLLPRCREKACRQSPADCGASCSAFEPEPPAWRTREWPIDGGPGRGIRRLLERRRHWVREHQCVPENRRDGDASEESTD